MTDRVRVMLWCTTCVPGLQLPLFAARAGGVFEKYGLEVEFVDPVPPRDMTLEGLSVRVNAVGAGVADFAVTGIAYLLAAQAAANASLGVRFVTTFHQRSPIAGIVPASSDVHRPADLQDKLTAAHGLSWMVHEYEAALAHTGIEPGPMVDANDGPYAARSLERGEAEVSPAWVDTIPSIQRGGETAFRAVPLDVQVYATGLLASDDVPDELAARMTDAATEGVALQRARPQVGIDVYHRHYPKASKNDLRLAWSMYAPNGPSEEATPMSQEQWENTTAFYARAYDLPVFEVADVCRPELVRSSVGSRERPERLAADSTG